MNRDIDGQDNGDKLQPLPNQKSHPQPVREPCNFQYFIRF